MNPKTVCFMAVSAVLSISACSTDVSPTRDFDPAYFIGSRSSNASANGLAFADGSQTLADIEGQEMSVRLIRFQRSAGADETVLIVTDETATLPSGYVLYENFDATMTLDGETLVFEDGVATLGSGQKVWTYTNYRLDHSGTGSIYTYAKFDEDAPEPRDMEGFFAFGFETNPNVIGSRGGQVRYSGSYFGYSQVFDTDGALTHDEMKTRGSIALISDFSSGNVSGRMVGELYELVDPPDDPSGTGEKEKVTFDNYEMVFLGAPIAGNGFVGVADITCPAGHSCTSDTSVAGAFYGPNGEEVSGVIALDERIEGPEGYGFTGAAGFSTTSVPD